MAAPVAKPAGEISARLANKPGFIGTNLLDSRNAESVWSVSGDWADSAPAGGSNRDDSTKPTRLIRDGFGNVGSAPTSITGLSEVFLLFDLVQGTSDAFRLDGWGIVPLNFSLVDSLGGTVIAQLQISPGDMADFSDAVIVSSFTSILSPALYSTLSVRDATPGTEDQVWDNVRYARIRFTAANTFSAIPPQVGEVILGKQRILAHAPLRPHDNSTIESDTRSVTSKSGPKSKYVRNSGRTVMPISFSMASNTTNFGIDEVTTLRDWWKDIDFGNDSFVYVARGLNSFGAAQVSYYMTTEEEILEMPMVGPVERQTEYTLEEQPPFRAKSTLPAPPTF